MSESALPTQRVEVRNSRETILAVALKLFTTKGYDGTSIDDIRAGAGFKSKASLYTHFKSKEEVAQALMNRIIKQIDDVFSYKEDDLEPLVRFTTVIRKLVEWANTHSQECVFYMIRGQQKKLKGKNDLDSKQPSKGEATFLSIVQQLRVDYPVRLVTSEVLLSIVFAVLAESLLDEGAFGNIDFEEKVEELVSICFGVIFSSEVIPVSKSYFTGNPMFD
ncbi:MAG: TetR/AcrR family transcriptional regulator [Calothrix sp. C42_A2020_038]|nr:TetR/AcrR family transcriptional regulator [Calothrix sp. C42_A2020_038]